MPRSISRVSIWNLEILTSYLNCMCKRRHSLPLLALLFFFRQVTVVFVFFRLVVSVVSLEQKKRKRGRGGLSIFGLGWLVHQKHPWRRAHPNTSSWTKQRLCQHPNWPAWYIPWYVNVNESVMCILLIISSSFSSLFSWFFSSFVFRFPSLSMSIWVAGVPMVCMLFLSYAVRRHGVALSTYSLYSRTALTFITRT